MKISGKMRGSIKRTNHWNDYPCDKKSLERLVTDELKDGFKMLEIGPWLGRTTMLFAELIGGRGFLYVVDNWHGTDFWLNSNNKDESYKNFEFFHAFCMIMQEKGYYNDHLRILNMSSLQAAELIREEFFDVIFLDADHRYKSVKKDIIAWWPKLKTNGLFIGHDCEAPFSRLSDGKLRDEIISNRNEERDFLPIPNEIINGHPGLHTGVIRAIYEIFNDQIETNENSSIWSARKREGIPGMPTSS